jgi:hypothetical protein
MDYIDLKISLAEATSVEDWNRAAQLCLLILSCREWDEETSDIWRRKATRYQMLAAIK